MSNPVLWKRTPNEQVTEFERGQVIGLREVVYLPNNSSSFWAQYVTTMMQVWKQCIQENRTSRKSDSGRWNVMPAGHGRHFIRMEFMGPQSLISTAGRMLEHWYRCVIVSFNNSWAPSATGRNSIFVQDSARAKLLVPAATMGSLKYTMANLLATSRLFRWILL